MPVPGVAGVCQDSVVPLEVRTVPAPPGANSPVPPFAIGRAVPERVIARVPAEVIGEPVIVRNAGTDAATDVTVPVVGVCQTRDVPFEVRTWFTVPTSVRPVPPEVVGSAVPERVIARVPEEVIGDPAIVRNDGTDAATDVTVPVPGVAGVCQDSVVPLEVRTVPAPPGINSPVPPFAIGRAVPERVIANVPAEVIGEPVIVRNEGTDAATDVTVPPPPPPLTVVHEV